MVINAKKKNKTEGEIGSLEQRTTIVNEGAQRRPLLRSNLIHVKDVREQLNYISKKRVSRENKYIRQAHTCCI